MIFKKLVLKTIQAETCFYMELRNGLNGAEVGGREFGSLTTEFDPKLKDSVDSD